ncbi:MAG TPA: response regulator [Methylomirabilota bacterium]|nr:response regulator [Methylomirabilota bacterium]
MLVVDGTAGGRELLSAILRYCGALVTAVESAPAALAVMGLLKPDVLVTDVDLPGADGYWLIRAVRALKPEDGGMIPAVAMSTRGEDGEAERVRAAGFAGYLRAPLDPWALCRLVAELTL